MPEINWSPTVWIRSYLTYFMRIAPVNSASKYGSSTNGGGLLGDRKVGLSSPRLTERVNPTIYGAMLRIATEEVGDSGPKRRQGRGYGGA